MLIPARLSPRWLPGLSTGGAANSSVSSRLVKPGSDVVEKAFAGSYLATDRPAPQPRDSLSAAQY